MTIVIGTFATLKLSDCPLGGVEPSGPLSLTPTKSGGLSFSFSKSIFRIRQADMAPRRRSAAIGLPRFLSPLSKSITEARQTRRESLGRVEWGTPVATQGSPDNPICRSAHFTITAPAVELIAEEPPELDIGEALLSVPATETLKTRSTTSRARHAHGCRADLLQSASPATIST